MNERDLMNNALKEIVVPKLRIIGFTGSFPHFRRKKVNVINLITFQFDKRGGGFVVELANCSIEGIITSWGEQITPNKVTSHDVNVRYRLGAEDFNSDCWFRFDTRVIFGDIFKKTAFKVLKAFDKADEWFEKLPY